MIFKLLFLIVVVLAIICTVYVAGLLCSDLPLEDKVVPTVLYLAMMVLVLYMYLANVFGDDC